MKTTKLVISLLALSCTTLFAEDGRPLKIEADEKWEVHYQGGLMPSFTLTRYEGRYVHLIFSRRSASVGNEPIPASIKRMAEAFLAALAQQESLHDLKKEYKIEKIEGVQYSGEAVVFEKGNGRRKTMFLISDGDGIWNGQFIGSAAMWEEAKEVLRNLKKS